MFMEWKLAVPRSEVANRSEQPSEVWLLIWHPPNWDSNHHQCLDRIGALLSAISLTCESARGSYGMTYTGCDWSQHFWQNMPTSLQFPRCKLANQEDMAEERLVASKRMVMMR